MCGNNNNNNNNNNDGRFGTSVCGETNHMASFYINAP